jgi:NADPH2:quinone reductase
VKAVVIHELGSPDALKYEDVPDPQIRPRQVLVRIKAASINRGDLGRREGTYRGATAGAALPLVLGWDVAGEILEVGEEVEGRHVGQRVVATLAQGGYAEMAAVNVAGTVPIPDNLSFEEAASIPIAFLTSWFALLKIGELQDGESVLVQSGGSGVGMAAVQIAKHTGAKVITTSGTEEKLERCREMGADLAISYRQGDVRQEVSSFTAGSGVNLVLESVGGETFSESLRCLAPGGRLVTVGNTSQSPSQIDAGYLVQRGLHIIGFSLSTQMGRGGVMGELFRIMELFEQGKLKTAVDRVFALKDAPEAHRYVADNRNFGKVLLVP